MIRGSCLCGGVAFEIDGRLSPIQLCHATRCRKATGSAFAPEVAARRGDFRWLRGEHLLAVYEAPILHDPPPYQHVFCRTCGSPMPAALAGTDFVVLLAGVLDDSGDTRPFRHVFVGQRAAWDSIGDELPQFELHAPVGQRLPRKSAP